MDKIDSIIFDMDGTLWNALPIYTEAWNKGLSENGIQRVVTSQEIASMTGWEKSNILNHLLPGHTQEIHTKVDNLVNQYSVSLIPAVKGYLYEGVKEGLSQLSEKYPLFILSNCDAGIIDLFMGTTGIRPFISGHIAHGENGKPKHENMKILAHTYGLQSPIYVGDTDEDSKQSEKAGIPFIHFTYGFGQTKKYHKKFDAFREFSAHYLALP